MAVAARVSGGGGDSGDSYEAVLNGGLLPIAYSARPLPRRFVRGAAATAAVFEAARKKLKLDDDTTTTTMMMMLPSETKKEKKCVWRECEELFGCGVHAVGEGDECIGEDSAG